MDYSNRGWVSFSQFACALSTIYRGDKEDILAFWFKMYDRDRDGFLDKEVRAPGQGQGQRAGQLDGFLDKDLRAQHSTAHTFIAAAAGAAPVQQHSSHSSTCPCSSDSNCASRRFAAKGHGLWSWPLLLCSIL